MATIDAAHVEEVLSIAPPEALSRCDTELSRPGGRLESVRPIPEGS